MYRLKSPLSAQMELTEACNNACLHCYNYWRYLETGQKVDDGSKKLTKEHFLHLLDHLIEKEVRTISFTGGEPFLRKDVLFDLVRTAKDAGMTVGINSNGALITDRDIAILKEENIDFLLISLLCDDPLTHDNIVNSEAHQLTSKSISSLIESGLNVDVNMVVSTYNQGRVYETAMYARSLGATNFSATPVLPCPLAKNHSGLILSPEQIKEVLGDLLKAKRQGMNVDVLEPLVHCMFNEEERTIYSCFLQNRSCSAGISDMVISPQGDVRPCILATQTYGNLLEDGWNKCWENLEDWSGPNLLPQECLRCETVDDCGGGCRIAALSHSNDLHGKDPYMTDPLTNSRLSSNLNDNALTSLNPETMLILPPRTSLRKEDFGSVVFLGKRFIFLDDDGTKLLLHLKNRGSFTSRSISEEINIKEGDLRDFLVSLLSRGFLATC